MEPTYMEKGLTCAALKPVWRLEFDQFGRLDTYIRRFMLRIPRMVQIHLKNSRHRETCITENYPAFGDPEAQRMSFFGRKMQSDQPLMKY